MPPSCESRRAMQSFAGLVPLRGARLSGAPRSAPGDSLAGLTASSLLLAAYMGWRIRLHPGPLTERDALVLHPILVLAGGFALPLLIAWGHALIVRDAPRLARWLRREAGWVLTCGLLAILGTGVYGTFGTRLAARGAFERYDTLFCSDRAPLAVSSAAGGVCLALAAAYFRHVTGSRRPPSCAPPLQGDSPLACGERTDRQCRRRRPVDPLAGVDAGQGPFH